MKKELDKTYDPKKIEDSLYKKWEDNNYFHAEPVKGKKPFTIIMPPPNITGQLHMGHALDNTIQDILVRFKRMQGYEVLWQPGTDHASIATEVKIIKALKEKGINKADLGREGFIKKAWEWRDEYGGRIIKQLKKMGSSADWQRERFTMDEGSSRAVEKAFIDLYNKGYIYKGKKIVNWCPTCKTTISDAEVLYDEGQKGHFWHIKYPIAGEEGHFIEIATTRPETMLGDEAIAVNPNDKRYKDLVGKKAILPIVNKEIPIISDSYVDMEFGTGAVKITPAHDPNDFEVGKRHDLPVTNIMNDDATINENGGKYQGMDRFEAREAIVKELDQLGLLVSIEDIEHNVGTHDRCGSNVEPMVKEQWFVRMDELAKPAIQALKSGELKFVPDRFNKTYLHWLENIRDWCISRQLWWGHRIPVYYCKNCGKTIAACHEEAPKICPDCGGEMVQDEDTLDTWFSSALWPFSTLGWPDTENEYYKYFYPTDVLVTGYDIIFFWVIRMVFSGIEHTGKVPFHTVFIHGLVRDSQGRKMSKSLGNGIDPLEVIDKYGADALRLTLITGNAPGNDMRFYWDRVEASRNFANKVWNASRFIMMNLPENGELSKPGDEDLTTSDHWIISRINTITKETTDALNKYELGIAVQKVYDFIWDEFCDWYIEFVKPRIYDKSEESKASRNAALYTLKSVLTDALKLLHPYMPFITEEIYCTLHPEEDSIMIASWPEYSEEKNDPQAEKAMNRIMALVKEIRNVRTGMNVPPSRKAELFIVSSDEEVRHIYSDLCNIYMNLAGTDHVCVMADNSKVPENAVSAVVADATVYIPLNELVDLDKERERLEKEKKRLEGELKRSHGMLSNQKFLEKAPEAKVKEERDKLRDYENMLADVEKRLLEMN